MMRARFPLLLLLGLVFLASVSVSFGISHLDEDDDDHQQQPRPFPYPRPHQHQHQPHQKRGEEDEEDTQKNNNPYYFSSDTFLTYFKNQYGHIRVLPKLNKRSPQLQNLRDYRIVELKSKPNTLLLPHHSAAESLFVILSGRAIITLLNPDQKQSYNLQRGDALRIPAGTTYYLLNPDDNENLRVVSLAKPVNKPGSMETFFLPNTEAQQSYLQGFSKNILEASYDTQYEEIKRVLFGEEKQPQQDGLIVEVSKEQIQALSKHAKSSSKKSVSSEDKPFNVKSNDPIYSNRLCKFYELTPEKNPHLQYLDMSLSYVDMNEGSLFLPHFSSKAIMILAVNKGEGTIQLVGLKHEQQEQQQQEQQPREVQRYEAELSEDDIFIIPAAYPVAITATSNLDILGLGLNAENNQRNFLAGEKDNVLSEIPSQVQELTFAGSAQEVEKVISNQKNSYFVEAQPKQKEEDSKRRQGHSPSVLRAFY